MADGNHSNPYRPHPAHCCERCAFGRGEHAPWCMAPEAVLQRAWAATERRYETMRDQEIQDALGNHRV